MSKTKIAIVLPLIIIVIIGVLITKGSEVKNFEKTPITEESQTKIVLYFSDLKNGELVKEYRNVDVKNIKDDMPKTIINELLKGPQNIELVKTIPNKTKVNSICVEDKKIIIDFSKEFKENEEDELKNLHKIYSVVNSLTEITEINEVEIRVEGEFITSKIRL